jgi:hypothetical protein
MEGVGVGHCKDVSDNIKLKGGQAATQKQLVVLAPKIII